MRFFLNNFNTRITLSLRKLLKTSFNKQLRKPNIIEKISIVRWSKYYTRHRVEAGFSRGVNWGLLVLHASKTATNFA
jgi:hypothetical protein